MLDTLGIEDSIALVSMQNKTGTYQQKEKHQNTHMEVQRRSLRAKGMAPSEEEIISNIEGAAPPSVQKEDEGEKLQDGKGDGSKKGDG